MDLLRQHYNFQGQSKAPMEQQDEGGGINYALLLIGTISFII